MSEALATSAPVSVDAWPTWYRDWRASMAADGAAAGWPTRRMENWKYTDLRPYEALVPSSTAADVLQPEDLVSLGLPQGAPRAVFVDGVFRPEMSVLDNLPAGVELGSRANASAAQLDRFEALLKSRTIASDEGLAALAAGLSQDGPFLIAGPDATSESVLNVVHVSVQGSDATAAHVHGLFDLDAGAKVRIVEHHLACGEPGNIANHLLDVRLGDGAHLEFVRVQGSASKAALVTRTDVDQASNSGFTFFGFDFGGGLVRHDVNARLAGAGAAATLKGVYALAGACHVDNHTRVDHIAPHTVSEEFFKGVLDERSRGVFNGKVVVHEGAEKIEAGQTNRNLLLSREAEIDTKPELEIYADDVQCAHGATVGQLDENQLFYLRSRGVPEADARQMLVDAFCREVVDQIQDKPTHERVAALLDGALPRRVGKEEIS